MWSQYTTWKQTIKPFLPSFRSYYQIRYEFVKSFSGHKIADFSERATWEKQTFTRFLL